MGYANSIGWKVLGGAGGLGRPGPGAVRSHYHK